MSKKDIEDAIKRIEEKVDDYNQTLEALVGFSHVLRWDDQKEDFKPNSYRFIARRMDTSEVIRIVPKIVVTPDLVIQLDENYGIVSEVKKSFPRDKELWIGNFNQIQKYDDDLKGWKTSTEKIKNIDIILLTH